MRLFWLETSNNLKQENISWGCSRSGVDGWVDVTNVTNVSSFVHPLVVWKLKFSLDRGDPRIKGTERNSTKHQQRYQTKVNSKLDFFWMPKKIVAVSGLPEYCFIFHFLFVRPSGVTYQLFYNLRQFKPYIFIVHIISADHPDHLDHLDHLNHPDHLNNLTTQPTWSEHVDHLDHLDQRTN